MKRVFLRLAIVLAGVFFLAPAVNAQTTPAAAPAAVAPTAAPLAPGLRKAAEQLLEALQMEKTTNQAINQMLSMQVQQRPDLKVVEPEMRAFMTKYMNWSTLKEDMVQLYAREFTEKELRDLTKFYQTATGQKYVSKQSTLIQAGMEIGQQRVRENLPELQRTIEAKMKAQQALEDKE